jgi:hypothetical protein
MLADLAATIQELASWVLSASMEFPVSQLSFLSWLMFAAAGALSSGPVQRK